MKGPFGSVIVPNISSHKEKGIGAWTDAELKRVLTEGIGRDGRVLKLPMARQAFFSRMTDQDLNALGAYQRHRCVGAYHSADRMRLCAFSRVVRISQLGESRRFGRGTITSGLSPSTDVNLVRLVP